MTRAIISRADLLRILKRSDPDALGVLAGSLEYAQLVQAATDRDQTAAGEVRSSDSQPAVSTGTVHWPADLVNVPLWRALAYFPREREETDRRLKKINPQIKWSKPPRRLLQYPFLAEWRELLPRLRGGLAEAIRSSQLDIRQATDKVARGQVLTEFPRLSVRKWGTRVFAVVDRSEHLIPFWRDQELVIDRLGTIIPGYALQYVVAEHPDRMRLVLGKRGCRAFQEAPEGSLLLVLGDLGLLRIGGESLQARWAAWVRECTDGGSRVMVLTPGSVQQFEPAVRSLASVVPWQPPRTAYVDDPQQRRSLVESLVALAAPLIRLEPGLLRCLRLILSGAGDASLEADAWQHPALAYKHPVAATVDRRFADSQLMDTFRSRPEMWQAVFNIVRSWRGLRSSHPEIWFEEINGLDPAMWRALPPADVEDALATAAYLRGQCQSTSAGDSDVVDYVRRMSERMTDAVANHPLLGPIYRELYRATHPPETHDQIAGYDPKDLPPGETRTLAVIHQGSQLRFVTPGSVALPVAPGPLAAVRCSQPSLVVRQPSFWKAGVAPAWADAWGWDEQGAYAEFSIRRSGLVDAAQAASDAVPAVVTQRMRWIAAGTFLMGSPETEAERSDREGPQHQVTISHGFWMFDTAVTQELWQAVMGQNPSRFQGPRRPVERVSWDDCQQFLAKLSGLLDDAPFSLPTEAQWEYACRAGTTTPFSFGDNITPEQVNYDGNYPYAGAAEGLYREETVEVGSLPGNRWGLYEMHGNVYEWCRDGLRSYGAEPVVDPVGPVEPGAERAIRGGCWLYDAQVVRSAYRGASQPGSRYVDLGFRCALVQAQAEPEASSPGREAEPRPDEKPRGGAVQQVSVRLDEDPACELPAAPRLRLLTDLDDLELERFTMPTWASAIGRDRYGLWAQFKLQRQDADEDVKQRMRWIPPGRFRMGSEDPEDSLIRNAKPQHEVVISYGFWMFENPVTQALWQAVMGQNPSKFPGAERPVEKVSWHDCHTFMEKLADRIEGLDLVLPSEAEWEYACRAGTQTAYSIGEQITEQDARFGGYAETEERGTVEVASYAANPWGLFDMHGNVWEWCFDGPRGYPSGTEVDPIGPTEEGAVRAFRGGSWDNDARYVRSASRDALQPGIRSYDLGFRCALVQAPAGKSRSERSGGPGVATEEQPGRSD